MTSRLLWAGLALIVLGLLALTFPFLTTLSLTLLLGGLLTMSGAVMIVHSFSYTPVSRLALALVWGIVTLVGGLAALVMPLSGAVALTSLLAAMFAITGLSKIALALMNPRPARWGMMLASGLISLALAALVAFAPFPAMLALPGVLVGVDLTFAGFTLLAAHSAAKAVESGGGAAALS